MAGEQKYFQARIDERLHLEIKEAARQDRRSINNWVIVTVERAIEEQKKQRHGQIETK